ncbi:hypothetical protein JW756_00435 [Candidatus Woesearchaeota archaeon]|nr:hypothetical protein [Candidatus Woesearchaeota archaeon]
MTEYGCEFREFCDMYVNKGKYKKSPILSGSFPAICDNTPQDSVPEILCPFYDSILSQMNPEVSGLIDRISINLGQTQKTLEKILQKLQGSSREKI